MMSSKDDIIKRMVEEMRRGLGGRLRKIVLYGSMARGEDSADSDYDCIAIVDSDDGALADLVDEIAGKMLLRYGAVFSIVTVSEKNFERQQYNPLYINILREGRTLWPKTA